MPNKRRSSRRQKRQGGNGNGLILLFAILLAMVTACGVIASFMSSHAIEIGALVFCLIAIAISIVLYMAVRPNRQTPFHQEPANQQTPILMQQSRRQWMENRHKALYQMSGWDFEILLASLLKMRGYEAQVTRGSGDQGVDILLDREGFRIAVQTKLWKQPVTNKAVQEAYAGMAHYNAQEAWVVTPSRFTESAKSLAQSTGVKLIDGEQLMQWIAEYKEFLDRNK